MHRLAELSASTQEVLRFAATNFVTRPSGGAVPPLVQMSGTIRVARRSPFVYIPNLAGLARRRASPAGTQRSGHIGTRAFPPHPERLHHEIRCARTAQGRRAARGGARGASYGIRLSQGE